MTRQIRFNAFDLNCVGTPVLYQTGASGAGKRFAARHAECVFVAAPAKSLLKAYVDDVRAKAAVAGRTPRDLLVYNLTTVIVAETDAAAQAKFEEYKSHTSYDGSLVFMSGWSGIDFGRYAPTDLVKKVETNAIVSMVEHFAGGEKTWSIEELARWGGIGGIGPVFVGSPSAVADILQEWVEATDADGFNFAYAVTPESFEDTVDLLVPELQRRGAYPTAHLPGTLRDKLFGRGDLLPKTPLHTPTATSRPSRRASGGVRRRRSSRPIFRDQGGGVTIMPIRHLLKGMSRAQQHGL